MILYLQYRVSIDLDSVFEVQVPGKDKLQQVYALSKNRTETANLFHLKIVVVYVDGSQCELWTDRHFHVIGREKPRADVQNVQDVPGNSNTHFIYGALYQHGQ